MPVPLPVLLTVKVPIWAKHVLVAWVAPQFMGSFGGNYDHLARVWEWHVVGGEDGGDAE